MIPMNVKFWSNQLYNDFYAIMNNFYQYNLTSYQSGTHPIVEILLKEKKLVRFWTYRSNLLKGFFNISKKMAFFIFLKSLWVHLHDVHALMYAMLRQNYPILVVLVYCCVISITHYCNISMWLLFSYHDTYVVLIAFHAS